MPVFVPHIVPTKIPNILCFLFFVFFVFFLNQITKKPSTQSNLNPNPSANHSLIPEPKASACVCVKDSATQLLIFKRRYAQTIAKTLIS